MSNIKIYNESTQQWESMVIGKQGPTGPQGPSGTVTTTSPITNSGTSTAANIGINYDAFSYGHNYVINGAFDIWQRGTSLTNPASVSVSFSADRWQCVRDAVQSGIQITRETAGLTGFQYCARVRRIAGDTGTNNFRFGTALETVNSIPLAGKSVTISFYAKAGANVSGGLAVSVYSGTGTDQGTVWNEFTGITNVINESVSGLSSSWNRYSYTGTVPANSTQLGIRFTRVNISGTAGADDWVDITGVQLEEGSVATPFRRNSNSIQGELAACQRYYFRYSAVDPYSIFAYGHGNSSTVAFIAITPPVTMRTKPSSVEFSNLRVTELVTTYAVTALTMSTNSTAGFIQLDATASGGSMGLNRDYFLTANNSTSAFLGISAEL